MQFKGRRVVAANLEAVNRLRSAMSVLSLAVAGLCAAGLSHGVVWSLTALGAIEGPYLTYRHDAIVAAVLAAAVFGCIIAIVALACAFASGVRGGDAWFASLHRTISEIGPARAYVFVGTVQLLAIVGLEALEQVLQTGHALGPTAALGAPLMAALPIHALCATVVVSMLFAIAKAVVRAESHVRVLLLPYLRRRPNSAPVAARARPACATDDIVRQAPLALRIANRPPPSIAA